MLINSAYHVEFIFYKFYLLEICKCKNYEIRILKVQNILPIEKKKKDLIKRDKSLKLCPEKVQKIKKEKIA